MKKKNLLSIGIFVSISIVAIFLLNACKKQNASDQHQLPVPSNVKQVIASMGFDTTKVVDFGDRYRVEGCVMLKKDIFKSSAKPSAISTTQARTSTLIDFANQQNITVSVDNSIPVGGIDDWRNEVQQAISYWNSASTCNRIRFTYTTDPNATIIVRADDAPGIGTQLLDDNVIAAADFPNNGFAGSQIRINLDFLSNMTVSSSQKTYNMVHELGHTIGFRHTNWSGLWETPGIDIPGTPTGSDPDPGSVMNGGTALNSWNGFSYYDRSAVATLYPGFNAWIEGFPSSLAPSQLNKPITLIASVCPGNTGLTYKWTAGGGYIQGSTTGQTVIAMPGSPVTFHVALEVKNSRGETVFTSKSL